MDSINELLKKKMPPQLQEKNKENKEEVKYCLIMYWLCKEYSIQTPLEKYIFSTIENMTRHNEYCIYKIERLAEYSGGNESDIAATLERFESNNIIESGFVKKTPGWRLTAQVRKFANFTKGKIDRYGKDPKRS
jgi:hypothetical protein